MPTRIAATEIFLTAVLSRDTESIHDRAGSRKRMGSEDMLLTKARVELWPSRKAFPQGAGENLEVDAQSYSNDLKGTKVCLQHCKCRFI
jgi:hypothetical protein